MTTTNLFDTSKELFDKLIEIANQTHVKILEDDVFFVDNANIFVKSYMVLMCAYLESYLKSLSKHYIDTIEASLSSTNYPKNLLRWSVLKDKYKHTQDGISDIFSLGISEDDIDKNLSANPHKTVPFFIRLGINLDEIVDYTDIKEQVEFIVGKRNNIVHYNDDAGGYGPLDIVENIGIFLQYMNIIDAEVMDRLSSFN